jgi:hypothetical protein
MSAVLVEQGSAMWIASRVGKLTASRVCDAFAKLKGGEYAKCRRDYMLELLSERLTGLAAPHYLSREMLEGIENEPGGVAAYEFQNDCECEPIGFVDHPVIPMSGASPDRAVGDVGLLEIKAPKTTTFIGVRLVHEHGDEDYKPSRDDPDDGYLAQCMWQLACCPGRQWVDLAYYDPRMPVGKQLYVRRINRDEKIIAAMETEARLFLDELAALEDRFR